MRCITVSFKWFWEFEMWCSPAPLVAWRTAGKKKPYTALLQCGTFLCRKKWGPQRRDFGGGYVFPGFFRVFVSTTGLESFSLRPEELSKRYSFGGGCVRFFLLWTEGGVGDMCVTRACKPVRHTRSHTCLTPKPLSINVVSKCRHCVLCASFACHRENSNTPFGLAKEAEKHWHPGSGTAHWHACWFSRQVFVDFCAPPKHLGISY